MKIIAISALVSLFAFSFSSMASSPTGGGSFPFFGVPDSDGEIKGIRINPGWGMHKLVYGLDLGLVGNTTTSEFVGMGLAAGFNSTHGKATIVGLQMAGVLNINSGKTHIGGLQLSVIANSSPGQNYIYGFQMSTIGNFGKNNIYGFQVGFYNEAEVVYGFQIGIINRTKRLHGVQIGLANFVEKGALPFFPVINVGF